MKELLYTMRRRILLFVLGLAVLSFNFFLFIRGEALTDKDGFIWATVFFCYCLFFIPFFFTHFGKYKFSGKIPSITILWFGIISFIAAAFIVSLLLKLSFIGLTTAMAVMSILIFFLAVIIYFAYFANARVLSVAVDEQALLNPVKEIKELAASLELNVKHFHDKLKPHSAALFNILEEISYISPAGSEKAAKLEGEIANLLSKLKIYADKTVTDDVCAEFSADILKLETSVKERKLLHR
jgi:hypothetical protein